MRRMDTLKGWTYETQDRIMLQIDELFKLDDIIRICPDRWHDRCMKDAHKCLRMKGGKDEKKDGKERYLNCRMVVVERTFRVQDMGE